MSVIRIVFLGTPTFACASLKSLIADKQFEIAGVVTQPDRKSGRKMQLKACPVKELAQENGLNVLSPESVNTPEILEQIKNWGAEAAVVVAFGQLMSQIFLDLFPEKVVNVHGSLLPSWRGAAPIQRSIIAGDKETGVALQVMVKKLDAGAVLGTRSVNLSDDKSALELHDELALLGAELLSTEFVEYLRGDLSATPQDESKVSYAPKIDKAEGQINFTNNAIDIHRQVLGLSMGPGTFAHLNQKKVKIHETSYELDGGDKSVNPGTITDISEGIKVRCGQGQLVIHVIQPESRPRMPVKDFLKGYAVEVGQCFN